MKIDHDFGQLPPRLKRRVDGWDAALKRGLRNIGAKVLRAAIDNLSGPGGSGSPGSYPVPRQTGTLARGGAFETTRRSVTIAFSARNTRRGANRGDYAAAVHEGFRAFGNPHAPYYPGRPFLRDAAESVDAVGEIVTQLERVP